LPIEQLIEFVVAVSGIVALCSASVVLVELLIRIIDAAGDVDEADLIILACELGEPVDGLDGVEFAIDINFFELID
jgi:hypothetical protein